MGIDEKYNYNGLYNKLTAERYLKLLEDKDYLTREISNLRLYLIDQSENDYSKSYREIKEEQMKYTIATEIGKKIFNDCIIEQKVEAEVLSTEYGMINFNEKDGGKATVPAYQTEKLIISDLFGYEVSLKQQFYIGDTPETMDDYNYLKPTPQDVHYHMDFGKLYQFAKLVEKGMDIDSIKEQFPDWSIEQLENRKVNTI